MNLRDKRPRNEESENRQKNMNSDTPNSNGSLQDLINRQSEIIQKQDSELQRFRSEMQKKDESIVKLNEELVTLNKKIESLNQSDLELQESKKIRASAAEARLEAARDMEKSARSLVEANRQKESNALEEHRLSCIERRLDREKQELDQIIQERLEQLLIAKQKLISLRLAKEWHSSLMLILYSVIMTIYFIVVHWQTVTTGWIFFTRFENAVTSIWEDAWPAVYHFWYWQVSTETGALIGTIVTAVLAAGAVFGFIKLFLWWKKRVDSTYGKKDNRKKESIVLILSGSMIFALIVCDKTNTSMTWIMLWFLIFVAIYGIYQTIRLIYFSKTKL